jgi:hypothetical protein
MCDLFKREASRGVARGRLWIVMRVLFRGVLSEA